MRLDATNMDVLESGEGEGLFRLASRQKAIPVWCVRLPT